MGCLSSKGQERAKAIAKLFTTRSGGGHTGSSLLKQPTHLFANNYDNPIDCERCYQTLEPISQQLNNLTINHQYGYPLWLGGNSKAAKAMLSIIHHNHHQQEDTITAGAEGVVLLVAWEHINIQYLVEYLGVNKSFIPIWDGSNFDTIYELYYEAGNPSIPPEFRINSATNSTSSSSLLRMTRS